MPKEELFPHQINYYLIHCPAIIAQRAEEENKHFAAMITLREKYKRLYAKLYLEKRAQGNISVKDAEMELEIDTTLQEIKDRELLAEISHRAIRIKKDKAENLFQMALEMGRTKRSELRGLSDTVLYPKKELQK